MHIRNLHYSPSRPSYFTTHNSLVLFDIILWKNFLVCTQLIVTWIISLISWLNRATLWLRYASWILTWTSKCPKIIWIISTMYPFCSIIIANHVLCVPIIMPPSHNQQIIRIKYPNVANLYFKMINYGTQPSKLAIFSLKGSQFTLTILINHLKIYSKVLFTVKQCYRIKRKFLYLPS